MKETRLPVMFCEPLASAQPYKRSKKNPNGLNQQVFKLDFEHPKREIMDLDEQKARAEKLDFEAKATQDQVDRAYCKLRAAEEVAVSVKEFFSNLKREQRKLCEQLEAVKDSNSHSEVDCREKSLRFDQELQEGTKKCDHEIRHEAAELDDAIEQLKGNPRRDRYDLLNETVFLPPGSLVVGKLVKIARTTIITAASYFTHGKLLLRKILA
ncbi:hypothetical protein BV898_14547 [Hypsibius exemplaris]|uniref:Uncharacterized protein n=1 Tax=Hypsibius exemplaris TaxID=2072580 RepID=A0A9X6RJI9_HYPEX|nr:hypothetical protein BV898_14547 [Hypsibius exemplaris]